MFKKPNVAEASGNFGKKSEVHRKFIVTNKVIRRRLSEIYFIKTFGLNFV